MEWVLFLIAILFFVLGVLGIVLPVIPSLPLIWLGVLIYAYFTGFEAVDGTMVLVTGAIALIGTIIDFVAGAAGAKAYGSTWRGILGAVVGGIVGMMTPLSVLGLIVGSAAGAFGGEYLGSKDRSHALRAMWGSMIGFVCGFLIKTVAAAWIIIAFLLLSLESLAVVMVGNLSFFVICASVSGEHNR